LPCMDKQRGDVGGLPHLSNQWRDLDEVGTCTNNVDNFHNEAVSCQLLAVSFFLFSPWKGVRSSVYLPQE
jgi:hypothetical protein